jgi:dolichol-phosphate mannosyltransferase
VTPIPVPDLALPGDRNRDLRPETGQDRSAAPPVQRQQRRPRLSVIVPTRNEAANLTGLRDGLEAALAGVDHEVIVVDDSSDAVTRPLLARIAAGSSPWRVLERAPGEQTGLATAVTAGLGLAQGAAVCVMDGDLQHPPEVVPRLLKAVESGADLAVASRYVAGGEAGGLANGYRQLVSRASRWAALAMFPESRRTSDPLTGFFCVRRPAIAGLELRPVGFKVLLELLVLCPGLKTVDVPFTFGHRYEGESKAGVRQGLLFLNHLLSLFMQVPESSQHLKFAVVTACSLAVFLGVFEALARTGLNMVAAWGAASLAGSLVNAVLQRSLTFRRHRRRRLLYRAFGSSGSLAGLATYSGLLWMSPRHPLAMGALAQAVALAIPLTVNVPGVRRWLRLMTAGASTGLHELGRHLQVDTAWWSPPVPEPLDPERRAVAPAGLEELIRHCAASTVPDLVVQAPSDRPQPRRNIESLSAIIVPKPEAGRVAVLVRRSVKPFTAADLEHAVRVLHRSELEPETEPPPLTVAKP